MMRDLSKYEQMRDEGAIPQEVYLAAKADQFNAIELIFVVRRVFGLSFIEGKEVTITAEGLADSLSEYQAQFIPLLDRLAELSEQLGSDEAAFDRLQKELEREEGEVLVDDQTDE